MKASRPAEPRRQNRLTRLGFHFLFVGTFAMLGGALRGFNLLLVLAGLLVGALIMQWRWSRRSIEAVSVDRRLPQEAFAGKPFRVRYRLTNHSRWMPAWMIRVEDKIESLGHSDKATAACGVGVISANQTVLPHYECIVTRRGRYRFGPISLTTTFPFALFRARQVFESSQEFHVLPQLLKLRGRWQQRLLTRNGGMSTTARRSGPSEGDFFGLREWQTGDSPKWIHWRTTARLTEPAVRQFERQRRFDTCVLVDTFAAEASTSVEVELAISLAATLLVQLIGSPSNRIVLAVAATQADAVVGGGSSEGKRRMLEMLADAVPSKRPKLAQATERALQIVGHTQDMIVISPRSLEMAKARDKGLSKAITPWLRRGCFRWIDVSDRDIDRWIVREGRAANGDPMLPAAIDNLSFSRPASEVR